MQKDSYNNCMRLKSEKRKLMNTLGSKFNSSGVWPKKLEEIKTKELEV